MVLKSKLAKLLSGKLAQKQAQCDDTNVIVSASDRAERDLNKPFDNLKIDWSIVARQLERWSERLRAGKNLQVDISFHYLHL